MHSETPETYDVTKEVTFQVEGRDLSFGDRKGACERQPVKASLSASMGSGVETWSEGRQRQTGFIFMSNVARILNFSIAGFNFSSRTLACSREFKYISSRRGIYYWT